VTQPRTGNVLNARSMIAEGRYHIAHSAIDNAFALKDKANVDIAVVLGGDDSFNRLVVQPEIKSLADIKGKTVAVDAVNTAYAFQLYEMLRQKGLNKGDYEVRPVGGTGQRLEAMTKDKTFAAAMIRVFTGLLTTTRATCGRIRSATGKGFSFALRPTTMRSGFTCSATDFRSEIMPKHGIAGLLDTVSSGSAR